MRIVLASRNAHKIVEMRRIAPGIDWVAMPDELPDPPETGDTFLANALEKARFVYAHTGQLALADDSGLEVDALGGRPGVYSKRFSPEGTDTANNAKLLAELGERTDRSARFRCVIALVGPGVERTASGSCEGHVGYAARGVGGFGYDPLFIPAGGTRAMAEHAPAEKDAISHRGAALAQLPGLLQGLS
ncbi:MAG: RdgB/HAM1 family non-canonical purine NTP pyrophosphatase [Pseudomonadota bacterium]|nr:RdgB/HAM1 family non-canonical purine NTP pyrophosphatase [Pseudomonadota bacterium]